MSERWLHQTVHYSYLSQKNLSMSERRLRQTVRLLFFINYSYLP